MNDFIARFAQAMCPGAYAVEFLPILDYVPASLARWKRDARADFHFYTQTFEKMFAKVKEDSVRTINFKVTFIFLHFVKLKGEVEQASFCATLLKPEAKHGMSDRESAWLAATL